MYFGTFGSIFLLTQVLQLVMGYSPLQAGIRMMAWTGATLIVAPLAGIYAERLGGRAFMVAGLALQAGALAWFAATVSVGQQFSEVVVPFVMAGTGMALVFAPSASTLLGAVRPDQAGVASGANNAIREVGGVFGVAVLSTVFAAAARSPRRRRSSTASSPRCGWARRSSPSARSWRRSCAGASATTRARCGGAAGRVGSGAVDEPLEGIAQADAQLGGRSRCPPSRCRSPLGRGRAVGEHGAEVG